MKKFSTDLWLSRIAYYFSFDLNNTIPTSACGGCDITIELFTSTLTRNHQFILR
jgi:hypothetical protein